MKHFKPLSQLSNRELEEMLDSEGISPAIAKKIEAILIERSKPTIEREEERDGNEPDQG